MDPTITASAPSQIPISVSTEADAAPLVVRNVSKSYRQGDRHVQALRGVDLRVEQGRLLAIMGASGSGKSTLLHLMAGLAQADEGQILISGQDLGKLGDRALTLFRRRRVGLVFQAFNLIPTLTAEENVSLPLLLDGVSPARATQRARELLATLGLADRSRHRPDALSGGEQQRVAIGRALVSDPAVLFADEPTGNLDSVNSQSVCQLLRDLTEKQGKSVVMVTHETDVAGYAHEVMVLKDGRVIERRAAKDSRPV